MRAPNRESLHNDALPLPALEMGALGKRGLPALTDEALFRACGVRIAFTGRAGGVSEGCYASLNCASHVDDDPAAVQRNRALACEALGVDLRFLIVPNQVHGTDIVKVGVPALATAVAQTPDADSGSMPADDALDSLVREARAQAERAADGVLVCVPGVTALLNFADCLPLIVVAPSGRFVVAHAGWRGAVAGVASKAVEALLEAEHACDTPFEGQVDERAAERKAAGFNAYIGPHIGPECFEVGADVEDRFLAAFGPEVVESPRHVSLARAVTCDLVRAGMSEQRIVNAGICTKCHPDEYFSYRATNGACGRHSALAVALPR